MAKSNDKTESKRPRVIQTEIADDGKMTFTVIGAGSFVFDPMACSDEVRHQAMLHGFRQKISDKAAMDAGSDASDKLAAMQAIAETLTAGDWSQRRGDGTSQPSGLIARAVLEYVNTNLPKSKQKTLDDIREHLATKTRAEVLAFRKIPEVAAIMDRLRAETGSAAKVDADALLAGLMA